ncbi:MAG: hypothetical protein GY859_22460 [Desulfobacterales bacterium]|nr:hypothetical protein [Desulfobacterales bacterium]
MRIVDYSRAILPRLGEGGSSNHPARQQKRDIPPSIDHFATKRWGVEGWGVKGYNLTWSVCDLAVQIRIERS